jgi:hypothetical protein
MTSLPSAARCLNHATWFAGVSSTGPPYPCRKTTSERGFPLAAWNQTSCAPDPIGPCVTRGVSFGCVCPPDPPHPATTTSAARKKRRRTLSKTNGAPARLSGLDRSGNFEETTRCRRYPLIRAPVAQRKSNGLLSRGSEVRILPGAPRGRARDATLIGPPPHPTCAAAAQPGLTEGLLNRRKSSWPRSGRTFAG